MTKSPPASDFHVILFAYHYPPMNATGAARPARFVKYLRRLGFEIDVISAPFEGPNPDPRAHRVPETGPGWMARIADLYQSAVSPYQERIPWGFSAAEYAARLIGKKQTRALISTGPPIGTHVAALRIARRFGIPWISDFRDPLLGNPVRLAKRAQPYYRHIERSILRTAARTVVNTEAFADAMKQRYPDCGAKIVAIPNGYDPEESFGPLPMPPRGCKVIAHVGSLYQRRHPGLLLASLDRLITRGCIDPTTVRLDLIGKIGELTVPIERFARLLELGCIRCDGKLLPQEEARRLTAEADGLLLLDLNAEDTSFQVPAKVYDYVLVGRPILTFTGRGSPTAGILERCGVPNVIIDPSDPEEIIDEAVLRYLAMPNTPVPASEYFRQNYDGSVQAARMAELLRSIR